MLPELSTDQIAERRAQLPLRPYPLLYFGWAHLCLLTAALTLAFDPRSVAGFFYHPKMLAVVHLVTLGWISSSILGALYLVLPMAFRVPLERRRIDGWIFWLYVIGVLGMVSHFWIDAPSGMIWSAGTVVLGLVLAALRFLPALAQSRVAPAVKLHLWFAFGNILLAGMLGLTVGLNKFFAFLPGGPLSGVLAHAHLAILGWATLVVMAAGYRLIPMLLPSAVPEGKGVWASALLMELGALGLATSLLMAPEAVPAAAVVTAAGLAAFGLQVVWMRRHPRPAPPARSSPDLGVLQLMQALGYLGLAVVLGLALVVTPVGVWKLQAAMAYGVALLLGFLSQIVVGVGSRIVPWAAYLWGFGDGGFRQTPPSPHELPDRRLQWLVLVSWTLAVPAVGLGLTFDWVGLIRVGGWLLATGTVAGAALQLTVLRRSRASFRSSRRPCRMGAMKTREVILGTLAYTVVTFTIAVVWHVVLFEDRYRSFGYFEGEPSFAIGFATILFQGLVLSILYPMVSLRGSGVVRGLKFSLFVGLFLWTSHVLAFVAKQTVTDTGLFIAMESFYLLLQFGLFGVLIGLIYARALQGEG